MTDFKDILVKLLPDIITYNDNEPYLSDLLQKVFAPVLNDMYSYINDYQSLYNPDKVKPELIFYLADMLGVELDAIEPYDVMIKKIKNAIPFYRTKGLYDSYKIIFNSMNYTVNIHDLYSPIFDNPMLVRGNPYNVERIKCNPQPEFDNSSCPNVPLKQSYGQVFRQSPSYQNKYILFKRLEDIEKETDSTNLVEFMHQWFKTPHFDIEFSPNTVENESLRTDYDSFIFTDSKNITLSIPESNYKIWEDEEHTQKQIYNLYTYTNTNELEHIYISEVNIKNGVCNVLFKFTDGTTTIYPFIRNNISFDNDFDFGNGNTYEDVASITFLIEPTPEGEFSEYVLINGFINITEIYTKQLYPDLRADINKVSISDFAKTNLYITDELIAYFLGQIDTYRPVHTVAHPILKLPFYDTYYTHEIDDQCSVKLGICEIERVTFLPFLSFWNGEPETYCCYGSSVNRSGVKPFGYLNHWGQTHRRELEPFDSGYLSRAKKLKNCKTFTTDDEQYKLVEQSQIDAIQEYYDREQYEKNGQPYYPSEFESTIASLPEKLSSIMSGVYVNSNTGQVQIYDTVLYNNGIINLNTPWFADDFEYNINEANFELTRSMDNRGQRSALSMKCRRNTMDEVKEYYSNVYGTEHIGWDCLSIKTYPTEPLIDIPTMKVLVDNGDNTYSWVDTNTSMFVDYDQSFYPPYNDTQTIQEYNGIWIPLDTICCGNADYSFIWDLGIWDNGTWS